MRKKGGKERIKMDWKEEIKKGKEKWERRKGKGGWGWEIGNGKGGAGRGNRRKIKWR